MLRSASPRYISKALQDKVKTWLPDLDIDERVTISHLLSHTSGIQSYKTDSLKETPSRAYQITNLKAS